MKLFIRIVLLMCIQMLVQFSHSGVGGIGGGTNAKTKYVVIKLCDGGESGFACREVRLNAEYYDENGNLKQPSTFKEDPCMVSVGEAAMVPCSPDTAYGIPKFMIKLNKIFGENSGQPAAPVDPNGY